MVDLSVWNHIAFSWVFVFRQNEGLRHMTQCLVHRLNFDLICFLEDASSKPGGKGKEVNLFFVLIYLGAMGQCCTEWCG